MGVYMREFVIDEHGYFIRDDGILEINDEKILHHVLRVLRMKIGNEFILNNVDARTKYTVEIVEIHPGNIASKILDINRVEDVRNTEITLFQALPKQGKMEYIVQKAVELGVIRISPFYSSRTIVKNIDEKKIARWQKIAIEATNQSKRGDTLSVEMPLNFTELLKNIGNFNLTILAYEDEKKTTIKDVLLLNNKEFDTENNNITDGSINESQKNIAIIIGPEGGFSEKEVKQLTEQGAVSATLGKTILRTETAGLVAASMVNYEYEL